jgi:hypothetical protein
LALFLGGDSLCGASFFGNVVRSFCGVSTFGVARNDPESIITVAMKNAARAAKSVAIRRD